MAFCLPVIRANYTQKRPPQYGNSKGSPCNRCKTHLPSIRLSPLARIKISPVVKSIPLKPGEIKIFISANGSQEKIRKKHRPNCWVLAMGHNLWLHILGRMNTHVPPIWMCPRQTRQARLLGAAALLADHVVLRLVFVARPRKEREPWGGVG